MRPTDLLLILAAVARAGDVEERVATIVASLTRQEKLELVNGVGWDQWDIRDGYYVGDGARIARHRRDASSTAGRSHRLIRAQVGNLVGAPAKGLPAFKMHDAGQGFRTHDPRVVGTVTSWPCALALASTFDRKQVTAFATAAATEFRAKGANVILGPGLNVHRVARGGRNAEYLSGEDPVLGAELASTYVEAFQSKGIMTVAKHFGFNQQETRRNTYDALVPPEAKELYYTPYKGAIEAGCLAVMCAYNKLNGHHACASDELLETDLRDRMAFRGFVVSDWAAAHQYHAGLDVAMPGSAVDDSGDPRGWYSAERLDVLDEASLDAHVSRVVRAAASVPGFLEESGCVPGSCQEELYATNATSSEHRALARDLAADSVVMLKNEGVLPLKTGSKIAVVGGACAAVHDAETLMKRWDLGDYYVVGGSGRVVAARITSVLDALRADGADIVGVSGDDLDAARAAAASADVVVACGGAATTEAADRASLRLDNHDFLTALVDAADRPVVLVALAPGAIVLPQADAAAAALVCFLCGEATGLAIADVLLGRKEPGPWRRVLEGPSSTPSTRYIFIGRRPRRRTAARDDPSKRGRDCTALRGRRVPVHRGRARRLPRYRSGRRALSVRPRPLLRNLRARRRGCQGWGRRRRRRGGPETRLRAGRRGGRAGLRCRPPAGLREGLCRKGVLDK
jgi:beta-glucosidase-like glycosyl hydrolase